MVKLAVAIQDLRISDVGQPRVRFPADAFLLDLVLSLLRWPTFCSGSDLYQRAGRRVEAYVRWSRGTSSEGFVRDSFTFTWNLAVGLKPSSNQLMKPSET